jgi:DNA-binding Lrp family transcriptional regulator
MLLAMSFIKAVPDKEKMVYHSLKELDGVRKIYHIFGDHDLLLILEAENRNKLMDLIDYVEEMGSVNASRTMLVATAYSYLMSTCDIRNDAFAAG